MGISGVWRVVFGGGTWDGFAEVEERAWQFVAEQVEGKEVVKHLIDPSVNNKNGKGGLFFFGYWADG